MKKIFTLKDEESNYVATICKIEEIEPIENSDFLCKTIVAGRNIVIPKTTNIGDIVIFVPVETSICEGFLSSNNEFEIGEYHRNANASEIEVLVKEANKVKTENKVLYDELINKAKSRVGFFNKHGRVRQITLRGCPSNGYIIRVNTLYNWMPNLPKEIDWDSLVGTKFDTVNGEHFCKEYIIPIKEATPRIGMSRRGKAERNLRRFDRLRGHQFKFHYKTKFLEDNIHNFNADSNVLISKKLHGTSVIIARILCNIKLSFWNKIKRFFGYKIPKVEYDNIYSSSGVIKNRYINPTATSFYGSDVWGVANDYLKPFLTDGMTIYGEIVGYVPGSNKCIQKDHDYGCKVGQCICMPYRITITNTDDEVVEWSAKEVHNWTVNLLTEHPELKGKLIPLVILYEGRFGDLYPEISPYEHWHRNVLEKLKAETRFHMELDEPMCENKVPAEGIVIRSEDEPTLPALKLKSQAHYNLERKEKDSGEVDVETMESKILNEN